MVFKQDETFQARESKEQRLRLDVRVNRQGSDSDVRSTLNVNSPAARIEVEDAFFNHNSAVMMPDTVVNRRPATTEALQASDPDVLALLKRFHPEVHKAC